MKLLATLSAILLFLGFVQTNATAQSSEEKGHGHSHAEEYLGEFDIDGISVKAKQGHGSVKAGKEGHLVVMLASNDNGQTVLRAWIGTEDRTMSATGKGDYDATHGVYNIHAIAPTPLPKGAKWWVEIEKPDGTKVVGSMPLLKDVKKG